MTFGINYGANTDINAATRCVLQAYNAAKCDCGRDSPRTPLGELAVLPQIP